jgi:hypothetical protein
MQAMIVASTLKIRMKILVTDKICLLLSRFRESGLIRFSEIIAAGANKTELVVLMIAERSEPKNKICTGRLVCFKTIVGNVNCESPSTGFGYRYFTHKLINNGSIAMDRYIPAAIKQERTAVVAELDDIDR